MQKQKNYDFRKSCYSLNNHNELLSICTFIFSCHSYKVRKKLKHEHISFTN